jgi:hypothetical protein
MLITSDSEPLALERVREMIDTFRDRNPHTWSVSLPPDLSDLDLSHPVAVRSKSKKRPALAPRR